MPRLRSSYPFFRTSFLDPEPFCLWRTKLSSLWTTLVQQGWARLAYAYTHWLKYFGPVQARLRAAFSWESATDYWFPNVRSIWGAIAMFTLTLYRYVYMLARVTFLEQSACSLEASRSLGCGPWRSFAKVLAAICALNLNRNLLAQSLSRMTV